MTVPMNKRTVVVLVVLLAVAAALAVADWTGFGGGS